MQRVIEMGFNFVFRRNRIETVNVKSTIFVSIIIGDLRVAFSGLHGYKPTLCAKKVTIELIIHIIRVK